MRHQHAGFTLFAVLAFATVGCASSPAAPFNQMEASNVTAFRLQNYEPPSMLGTPGTGAAGAAMPAPIQQWLQQGAQGLQQLIPPGLLPPGLLPQQQQPGVGQPQQQTPLPMADNTPRFHGFRILGQTQVIDPGLKAELADVLGDSDNFTPDHAQCLYAEMGIAFAAQPGAPSNDVLISFSCNQVSSPTFPWPHPSQGLTADAVKSLSEVVQKLWPPGT